MVKRLLSFALTLTVCVGLSAQELIKGDRIAVPFHKSAVKKAPMKVQGSVEFTYVPTGDITDAYYAVGTGQKSTYLTAMYIPADFAGKSIKQVNFLLYDTSVLSSVKVWENATLPTSATKAAVKADSVVLKTNVGDDVEEIQVSTGYFSTPITVPDEGCYVGISFTVKNNTTEPGMYPLLYYPSSSSDCVFYKVGTSSSSSWYDGGEDGYNFALSAVISGDYPDCNVTVSDATSPYVLVGDSATVSIALINNGLETTSLSYVVKDVETGATSEEQTVEGKLPAFLSGVFSFKLEAPKVACVKDKQFILTKVNGKPNEAEETVVGFRLGSMSQSFPRKAVEEEFTATGCGYCCRGYAGMSYLADTYPDSWIGIAVHAPGVNWYDPMYCEDYEDVAQYASGYPSALMNRMSWIDPYYGSGNNALDIDADYQYAVAQPTEALVSAKAAFDEDQNKICVVTDVQFSTSDKNADYGLAYVLLANGLKAPETTSNPTYWYQYDPFYGQTGYEDEPYLYAWVENEDVQTTAITLSGQSYTLPLNTNMTYNHVAVAASDILEGAEGSIPTVITDGMKRTHVHSFDITDGITSVTSVGDDLIQDKSKLEVVAMLIDRNTGLIVNADKCAIMSYTTGIEGVSVAGDSESASVAYYSADGARLAAPQKGLNIVKMANGRTMKIMKK